MKKQYESPVAEKVSFCYSDQVVASGGSSGCDSYWINVGLGHCESGNTLYKPAN